MVQVSDLARPVTKCRNCDLPVIEREDGKVLDAEPHPFGINHPEAGTLLPSEIAKAFHGKVPPIGHVAHRCSPAEQQALFDIVAPASASRRRL